MGVLDWVKGDASARSSRQGSMISKDDDARSLLLEGLGSLPSEIAVFHPEDEEHRYIQRRIRDNPMWTLDRGTGYYVQERISKKKASLLGSDKDAGKSMVEYSGIEWTRILRHVWKRDFFTTAIHARFQFIVLAMILVFISTFLFWAVVYYIIWNIEPRCFVGFHSFLSAFLFSIETQNTIGYGSHAIGDCWLPAWLVGIQCILAVLLEAIFLGIIFAKISHPKGRSRTIIISECATIARRDGILKFMFRVADIRKRTAIGPKISAHLYTWGHGHTTAEGEHMPVQVQDLPLHFLDATLLLPVVVEHTIDERSPLYGHTSQSLAALSAEIVVTFEGSSELGDAFMTRRSYLPSEIHWGCKFVNIISHASPGCMKHKVDLSRFHEVEPQEGLALMPPDRLSRAVVMGGSRRIPRPRLSENTLQLADELVVTQAPDGTWFVAVRVGDAYPSQMCSARVQMFIYRYNVPTTSPPRQRAAAAAAGSSSNSSNGQPAAPGSTSTGGGAVPSLSAAVAAASAHPNATYVHQELALTRHLWRVDPAVEAGLMAEQQQQPGQQQQMQLDPVAAVRVSAAVRAAAAASAASHAGGGVNVLLRYPVVVGHEITADSPLKEWITHDGMLKDADAEIVVVTSATMYCNSKLAMRSKVYSVLGSIRWGSHYASCVVPPGMSPTGHALVDWNRFHEVVPFHSAAARKHKQQQRHGAGAAPPPAPSSGSGTPQDSFTQQARNSRPGLGPAAAAAAWFNNSGSADVGASWGSAVNGSYQQNLQQQQQGGQQQQQQQHEQQGSIGAPDAFEAQVEQLVHGSFSGLPQHQQEQLESMLAAEDDEDDQQQQQQMEQQPSSGSRRHSRSGSSRLSSVVVHDSLAAASSSSSTATHAHDPAAASIPLAVAVAQRQRQQQQQQHLGMDSPVLYTAHSLGFDHFHDVAQLQTRLQQQQQLLRGGQSSFRANVRQGISSASQLHDAAAAAVAARYGGVAAAGSEYAAGSAAAAAAAAVEAAEWARRRSSQGNGGGGGSSNLSDSESGEGSGSAGFVMSPGPSCEAAMRYAVGGGGFVQDANSAGSHTFRSGSHSSDDFAGNRSLAAVMDLFQIAEQQQQEESGATAAAGAAAGAGAGAAPGGGGGVGQQQQPPQQQQQHQRHQQQQPPPQQQQGDQGDHRRRMERLL